MTDFYPLSTNLCNSSGLILSLMSTVRALRRKVYDEWLIEGGISFFIGMEMSCLARSFSVLALHGVFPVNIS